MATTVIYKGSTLTTATNQTRVLKTADKYMEDDVTVVDSMPMGTVTAPVAITAASASFSAGADTLTLRKLVPVAPLVTTSGYVSSALTRTTSVTLTANIPTLGNVAYFPSTSPQIISSNQFLSGQQTILPVEAGITGVPFLSVSQAGSNALTIAPMVTNSTGYILGGTLSGEPLTVSASGLVSGTMSIAENGMSINVANYSFVDVGVYPALAPKTISANGTYMASADYLDGYNQVMVNVPEPSDHFVPSGMITLSSNGVYNVSSYASATVSVPYTGRMLTISGNGGDHCYTRINNNYYVYDGQTANFNNGDELYIVCEGNMAGGSIYVNGSLVSSGGLATYTLPLPHEDVLVKMSYSGMGRIDVNYNALGSKAISQNGTYLAQADSFYGYSQVTVNVPGGVGDENLIIARALSGFYSNSTVATIGPYAFWSCSSLTGCSFENALEVGYSAFGYCTSLSEVYIPNAISLGGAVFQHCSVLTSISAPNVTHINGPGLFRSCSALSEVYFPELYYCASSVFENSTLPVISAPKLETAWSYCFRNCSIISASFPRWKGNVGDEVFANCYQLEYVSLPLVSNLVNRYAFSGCSNLQSLYMPSPKYIYYGAFLRCLSLPMVSFDKLSFISNSAFYDCRALESVYLLGSAIANLDAINAFSETPISKSTFLGYFGSIYVRQSMLSEWQSATNWTVYSARFVGLTDEQIAAL